MIETVENKDITIGNLVWWSLPTKVTLEDFNKSLEDEGLQEYKIEISDKKAFNRATTPYKKDRIVKKVADAPSGDKLFQFTSEKLDTTGTMLEYNKEASVVLNTTGEILCEDSPELKDSLVKAMKSAKRLITTSDVNKILEAIITKESDLFPIKNRISIFAIPLGEKKDLPLLSKLENILENIGGRLSNLNIQKDKHGIKIMKQAVSDGLTTLITDYESSIEQLKPGIRVETIYKLVENVKLLETKAEGYKHILEDQKTRIEEALKACKDKLVNAVKTITMKTDEKLNELI